MAVDYLNDPNSVNINENLINAIPEYQDMHIFAELTATARGRSVIVMGKGLSSTTKSVNVNFIGNNQNIDSPNYLNFTTNYYDGSTAGNETQYESFGISNIKVTINSSYVPQVNITFVDIRGLSFFNQENSPYRILFDFPPPIFNLKIRGYYGKTLEYKLHLVKYTSEFKSENGNFVIDAHFVAITFAPLSDVLFRYVVNFPLMDKNAPAISSDTSIEPVNTYDLILKLKNLYSAVNSKIKTDIDSQNYDRIIKQLTANSDAIFALSSFRSVLGGQGTPFMFIYDGNIPNTTPNTTSIIPLSPFNELNEYDEKLKASNKFSNPFGLFVGWKSNYLDSTVKDEVLLNYRKQLLLSVNARIGTNGSIIDSDISLPEYLPDVFDLETNQTITFPIKTTYSVIDITNYYNKLYQAKSSLEDMKKSLANIINTKINNAIEGYLGMRPTIYNIFKIILNDVDKFFDVLRTCSNNAEYHHNIQPNRNIIANNNLQDSGINDNEKIYSFPLIIKSVYNNCNKTETRTSPKEINDKLPASSPFPELSLINDFINTFSKQKDIAEDITRKQQKGDNNVNSWFPISPLDTATFGTNISSPYLHIIPNGNGVNTNSDIIIDQILNILLERFYILSQNSLSKDFYGNKVYSDLYSKSEAYNLVLSINNSMLSSNLKTFATNYSDPTNLYNYLKTSKSSDLKATYDFLNDNTIDRNQIDGIYVDKTNDNFSGVIIYDGEIALQQTTRSGSTLTDQFTNEVHTGFLKSLIMFGPTKEESFSFTDENLYYINDISNGEASKGINFETRQIDNIIWTSFPNNLIDNLTLYGNNYFDANIKNITIKYESNNIVHNNDVYNWTYTLTNNDDLIKDDVILNYSDLSAIILLSNFGSTISPFNKYPNHLNLNIFSIPAAVEVPRFLPLYIGSLVDADSNGMVDQLKTFFYNAGKNLNNNGFFIFADIYDINNNLSKKDKQMFKSLFRNFMDNSTSEFVSIHNDLKNLYIAIGKDVANGIKKFDAYSSYLNPNFKKNISNKSSDTDFFETILKPLLIKTHMIVFSQTTFNIDIPLTPPSATYICLAEGNNNTNKKIINDSYFKNFLTTLNKKLIDKEEQTRKKEEEQKKLTGDEDVLTQTYYSFKNINDKWLCDPEESKNGYPYNNEKQFNNGKNSLIDSFVFVDRAMNPIGNTIINPQMLIDMFDDTNISIFTVLSQLLSVNGFEFFPLQNFMTNSNDSWKDSFKIDPIGSISKRIAFVCMYIGGSSSYPTNLSNEFKNDGIVNIGTTDATDFRTDNNPNNKCNPVSTDDAQVERIGNNFPWSHVRAFKVMFGQQNQSMFTEMKIESKEYPETNESIKILAMLAGDEKNTEPIPKGQNLYNLYENRAYRATITGLGNAMIQPTQYFQLDNVPIYNGAYVILSVEHDITANKMSTSFSGTKILRYPIPRVLNPAAIMGFEGGSSEATSIASSSAGEITAAFNTENLGNEYDMAKYNSMYKIRIQ